MKPGRNDPCPCGSGKKFKHCCSNLSQAGIPSQQTGRGLPKEPTANEQNQLIALHQAKQYAELENQAGQLLKLYPDSGFGWKILSAALAMQGKDDFLALQRAANLLPQDAHVHNNLGDRLAKQEMLQEAKQWFRSAVRINSRYPDAHYNLAQVLIRLENRPEAVVSLKRTIEIQPDYIDARVSLATILKDTGSHQEAESQLRLALQLDPTAIGANQVLGKLLLENGRFAEAEKVFRTAAAKLPNSPVPLYSLVSAGKVQTGDKYFAELVNIAQKQATNKISLSQDEAIALHFGLGKCYSDTGDSDHAFEHFAKGCSLKRATVKHDSHIEEIVTNKIIQSLSKSRIAKLAGAGNPSEVPIFVVGMPRSGTTLTEQIIASHPRIYGAGELSHISAIAQLKVDGLDFPESLQRLDLDRITDWGNQYINVLNQHAPGSFRITDKQPQNFFFLGLIHLMLPNAKIIHVKRNPIDTCLSCFTNMFVTKNMSFSYDLAELGNYYKNYVRLMTHWQEVLPTGSFLEVQYEEIVADQEAQSRRLIEYCGLEWDEACLKFYDNKRTVQTASLSQVRRPMYKSSVERWRQYERHLGPLLDVLGDLVPNR